MALALFLAAIGVSGCAGTQPKHVWREIKGVGVPYRKISQEKGVLAAPLESRGRVWLPAKTTIYFSKPWHRSPYGAVYSFKLPGCISKWPCTAETVGVGTVYFSFAVIPKMFDGTGGARTATYGDGKTLLRPE